MRVFAPLLMLAAMAAALPARAQVSVDTGALNALSGPSQGTPEAVPAPAERATRPSRRATTRRTRQAEAPLPLPPLRHGTAQTGGTAEAGGTSTAPGGPQPAAPTASIPAAPPPPVAIPPPAPSVPTRAEEQPPAPPLVPGAPGGASEIRGGLRVTFGKDRADLNEVTLKALQRFAVEAKQRGGPVTVYATAAGVPNDPSTPRRLSLSRALAARAVLMSAGIPSTRIYVRAMGARDDGAVPDRVDVTDPTLLAARTESPK